MFSEKRVIRRSAKLSAGSRGDPLVVDFVFLERVIAFAFPSLFGSLPENRRTSGFLPDRTR